MEKKTARNTRNMCGGGQRRRLGARECVCVSDSHHRRHDWPAINHICPSIVCVVVVSSSEIVSPRYILHNILIVIIYRIHGLVFIIAENITRDRPRYDTRNNNIILSYNTMCYYKTHPHTHTDPRTHTHTHTRAPP